MNELFQGCNGWIIHYSRNPQYISTFNIFFQLSHIFLSRDEVILSEDKPEKYFNDEFVHFHQVAQVIPEIAPHLSFYNFPLGRIIRYCFPSLLIFCLHSLERAGRISRIAAPTYFVIFVECDRCRWIRPRPHVKTVAFSVLDLKWGSHTRIKKIFQILADASDPAGYTSLR